jgi:O-antigen/teichoic acid export membrane protein
MTETAANPTDATPPASVSVTEAPAPAPPSGGSLRSRTIKGSMWTTGGYIVANIIRLGTNLILTHLFLPEIFGLMTLVNIFIQGLQMFSDVGIAPAIIQNPRGDDPDFLNTVWTIQVFRGIILWIGSCVIAWPLAQLYGLPELTLLIPAAGLNALISGFNATSLAHLVRHLRFARLTLLELASQVLGFVAIVSFCWFSPTVWAFIFGGLVSNLLHLVVSHRFLPGIKNRFRWEKEARTALFQFGRWIFLSTLLTFLAGQADRLIFGKIIPLPLLGVYNIAAMLALMPAQAIAKVGGSIAFAAYSRVHHDTEKFRDVFSRVRVPLLVGGGLLVTGLIACGPPVIRLLYPPAYSAAGWIVQILAVATWFEILQATNVSALLAVGKTNWIAGGNAAKLLSMVVLLPLGYAVDRAYGGDGFRGAVIGIALTEIPHYLPLAFAISRRQLKAFRRDVALTLFILLASVLCIGVDAWVIRHGHGNLLAMLGSGTLACLLWAPLLFSAWHHAHRGAASAPAPAAA